MSEYIYMFCIDLSYNKIGLYCIPNNYHNFKVVMSMHDILI